MSITNVYQEARYVVWGPHINENWLQRHQGLKVWRPGVTWKPVSEELIKEALEFVLDVRNHPVMIMCSSGIHETGVLVGCLRRLQFRSMTSIIEEVRISLCRLKLELLFIQ